MILREAPDAGQHRTRRARRAGKRRADHERRPEHARNSGTHFTGIHAMHRDAIARIPEGISGVIETAYKELVPLGAVRAVLEPGATWFDIGRPPPTWRRTSRCCAERSRCRSIRGRGHAQRHELGRRRRR
jgi:NDP-sugar pyrophosphorylase family protein